jgi:dGTPase
MTIEEKRYDSDLKKYIKSIIIDKGPESFDEVFRIAKGAFPTTVYSILSDDKIKESLSKKINDLKPEEVNAILPEPNPVNFDWRFDKSTVNKFISLISGRKYRKVALFGTPSLFSPLSKCVKEVMLYDINTPIKKYFGNDERIIIADLNDYEFSETSKFDCVIMDPPWYLNYYKIWLEKSIGVLKTGGDVCVTLFQEYLRPKAKEEIAEIKKIISYIGKYEVLSGFVTYITPLFERELFNYYNIPCFTNWRTADLLIIKKNSEILPLEKVKYTKDKWVRIQIGTQLVALKNSKDQNEELGVKFPYENAESFIRSVSNRDSIRAKMNFITSRNRGLITKGNFKLIKILEAISKGIPEESAAKIFPLSKAETTELSKIFQTIYL